MNDFRTVKSQIVRKRFRKRSDATRRSVFDPNFDMRELWDLVEFTVEELKERVLSLVEIYSMKVWDKVNRRIDEFMSEVEQCLQRRPVRDAAIQGTAVVGRSQRRVGIEGNRAAKFVLFGEA